MIKCNIIKTKYGDMIKCDRIKTKYGDLFSTNKGKLNKEEMNKKSILIHS